MSGPYDWTGEPGERQISASSERNRDPILDVLRRVFPASGRVLEIASGTGTHAAWFVQHLSGLQWQPTDLDPDAHRSIEAWRAHLREPRLLAPIALDVLGEWPEDRFDAVFCANMIHIAPYAAAIGLFQGAGSRLPPEAPLALYGPFHENGPTSSGNAAFDARLRARDPRWGIRELDRVAATAEGAGFDLDEVIEMPANNRTLVFRRR